MEKSKAIEKIVDDCIYGITKRMTGIELVKTDRTFTPGTDVCSMYVSVGGTYKLSIIYLAADQFMRIIAEQMKRSKVQEDEEIEIYTKEYFNVLCGHVVTQINRHTQSSARFGMPSFERGFYRVASEHNMLFQVCYQSEEGKACIQAICEEVGSLAGVLDQIS